MRQTPPGSVTPTPDASPAALGTARDVREPTSEGTELADPANDSVAVEAVLSGETQPLDTALESSTEPEVRWLSRERPRTEVASPSSPIPEPTLRIGQIDVIVAAPERPPVAPAAPKGAATSLASRSYLRSL